MPEKSLKMDYMKFGIIVFLVWTVGASVVFYLSLKPYSSPSTEQLRSSAELISALVPALSFQCYKGDESKVGTDIACENKVLYSRDLMIYYTNKVKLFMFFYFTVPLIVWMIYIANPKLFKFMERFAK